MPLVYMWADELECSFCLHTWTHALDCDREYDRVQLNCPKCNEQNTFETDEMEISYGDENL